MSDNALKGDELSKLKALTNLTALFFGGNHIKTYKELEPLKSLPNLTQLDLFNNPVARNPDYRETVFGMLPKLEVDWSES